MTRNQTLQAVAGMKIPEANDRITQRDKLSGIGYTVMARSTLRHGELLVRAVDPQDIESIRQWRNAQMEVLRQTAVISPEAQEVYFAEQVWPDKSSTQPEQILLAIERDGSLIGYGGLVHIAWQDRRAEVSFLLAPPIEHAPEDRRIVFSNFLRLVQELAFKDLGLSRLWTETYAHRSSHLDTLEAAGFRREGCLRSHVIINNEYVDSLIHGLLASEWK